jgi:hypothetical protein
MSENAKKVIRRAYRLGYEVGYFNHLEDFWWVAKEKDILWKVGRKYGILDKVIEEYKRGLNEGREKKRRDLRAIIAKRIEQIRYPSHTHSIEQNIHTDISSTAYISEDIEFIVKSIPIIGRAIQSSIIRLEDKVRVKNEFIKNQRDNIVLMEEGINICNGLIKETEKEVRDLENKIVSGKNTLKVLHILKEKIERAHQNAQKSVEMETVKRSPHLTEHKEYFHYIW